MKKLKIDDMTELKYSKTEKKIEFKLWHVRVCTYVTAPQTDGIGEKKIK